MKTTQTTEELQKQVNYWRDKYRLENKCAIWLDNLAEHLRNTDDTEIKEQADQAYEEYQEEQIKFNSKHH